MSTETVVQTFIGTAIVGLLALVLLPAAILGVIIGANVLAYRVGFNIGCHRLFRQFTTEEK